MYDPLKRKEAAATDNRRLDLFLTVPAIHAAVGVKNFGRQFVHQGVSLAFEARLESVLDVKAPKRETSRVRR